jgi:hypothetical protein
MKIGKVFLAIGIAVILAIFIAYAVSVIYKMPKMDCEPSSAEQTRGEYYESREYRQCIADWQSEQKIWEANSVLIIGIIGIIAIVLGFILIHVEAVGSGILGGGIILVIYDVLRYWRALNEYLRLLILAAVLILLIYFGYRMFKKQKV